jgi:hypothetical protein
MGPTALSSAASNRPPSTSSSTIPTTTTPTFKPTLMPTCFPSLNSQSDILAPGGSLSSGQFLTSADGRYQLILKSTGALVGYSVSDETTFWSAGPSSGRTGPGAILSGTTSLPKSGGTVGSYILLLKF